MAVKRYTTPEIGHWDVVRSQYVCDTEAELPVAALDGDWAYCKDTNTNWLWEDSSWAQAGVAWSNITGTLSAQTDIQTALNDKAASAHTHAGVYEPADAAIQAHVISAHAPTNAQKNSDILQAEIEAKLVGEISSHTHAGGAAAWGGITGTLSDQTDLQTALDGKAASSHTHTIADTTNLQTTLDGKAASSHTHAIADVTNLQTTLDAKEVAANKGAANGYASLDAVTKVPIVQVPTGATASTVCIGNDARLSDARTPTTHAASHQNAGGDEISVAGLSGLLADAQTPATHATSHKSGGSDTVKLDELAAPTDVTTLNASTSAHGLMQKYPGGTTNFLRADGSFAAPPGGGGGINTLRKTANQTINGGAATFVDITDLTFPVVSGTDYAFEFYITFQSAASTTGWKAGVNCPAGTLDFWAGSDVIANGAAGVATHTERHNTVRDDMTLLTATVTQAVDLNVRIKGRYLCTANGIFAARFANELANTNIVVQKGSWGWWF